MLYSADLASFLFEFLIRAEILLSRHKGVPGFPCRAIFGVCEEILVFQRNIHLCNDDGGFEDAAADDGDDGSHDALLLVFSGAHSAMSS